MSYKLLSYYEGSDIIAGIMVNERIYKLSDALADASLHSMIQVLEQWKTVRPKLIAFAEKAPSGGLPLAKVKLAAPVPRPPTIYCAGANYTDHVANMARALNQKMEPDPHENGLNPWHFIKSSASVVGTGTSVIATSKKLDWEAELALVVGARARGLTLDNALDCIAAVTNANDFSARDYLQREQLDFRSPFKYDWIGQKSFDGSCPLGPWLTPLDDVDDIQSLPIQLWINGEMKQNSNTRNMIFTAAEQLVQLSSRLTLYPGDVILTGTPAGTGAESGNYLKPNDVVTIKIGELGELVNKIE